MPTYFFVIKTKFLKQEGKQSNDVDSTMVDLLRDVNDSNYNYGSEFSNQVKILNVMIDRVIENVYGDLNNG